MSPQKEDTITRREQEPHMVVKDNKWTLGSPTTTSKMGSLSASIATNMDIWQKNAEQRGRNAKPERVSNAKRKDILPKTVKESR